MGQYGAADVLLGRSRIRRQILGMLVAEPKARWHLREIARRVGTSAGTATRELRRLTDAGVVERATEGQRVYYSAKAGSPLLSPVRRILASTADPASTHRGPDPVGLSIARRLAKDLATVYRGRLRGVYLYGSRATGRNDPDSDVDVLVVLDAIDDYGADLRRSSSLASDLSLQHGITISRTLLSESEWLARERPFVRSVASGAVAV
jgi:predicted nucleotidyltransferase/DNA-binding HxlR family transcriptional regulator